MLKDICFFEFAYNLTFTKKSASIASNKLLFWGMEGIKMRKFVVGVDADGVLTDMSKYNIEEGMKYFKKEPVDPAAYHTRDIFGVSKTAETIYGLRGALQKYCTKIPPRPQCQAVINKLNEEGIELHEITARKFTTFKNVIGFYYRSLFENWLKRNKLNFKSIQYCSETFSPRDKLLGCRKLNVDVMIEDKPDVALHLAEKGVKVLLVDAPYNQGLEHENMMRVYTWDEIYTLIHQLKEDKDNLEDFSIKTLEERQSMSAKELDDYFNGYHHYLKNLEINEKALKAGKRKFKLVYNTAYLPIKVIFNPKVRGKENIPYQEGFIVASNHLTSKDQYMISYALGNRHFSGFAASTIENSFRGKLFKLIDGSVFIDRTSKESKKAGEIALSSRIAKGNTAIIFPEGTRKNKDEEGRKKEQLPFQLGTVSMAQKTGAPILPVSIYYGKKRNYVKFDELFFVYPTDDIVEKNIELEQIILGMTRESIAEDTLSKEEKMKVKKWGK